MLCPRPGLQDPGGGDSDILLASGHISLHKTLCGHSEHKPRRNVELWAGKAVVRTFWSTSPQQEELQTTREVLMKQGSCEQTQE